VAASPEPRSRAPRWAHHASMPPPPATVRGREREPSGKISRCRRWARTAGTRRPSAIRKHHRQHSRGRPRWVGGTRRWSSRTLATVVVSGVATVVSLALSSRDPEPSSPEDVIPNAIDPFARRHSGNESHHTTHPQSSVNMMRGGLSRSSLSTTVRVTAGDSVEMNVFTVDHFHRRPCPHDQRRFINIRYNPDQQKSQLLTTLETYRA
jgi:hypothetical protein